MCSLLSIGIQSWVSHRDGKLGDIPPEALEFIQKEGSGLTNYTIDLKYDYWTAGGFYREARSAWRLSVLLLEEILHAFLPEELREGSPTGFAMVGHIGEFDLPPMPRLA